MSRGKGERTSGQTPSFGHPAEIEREFFIALFHLLGIIS
jgi:hypothetical protein